jgi:hypothetical protein
VIRRTLHVLAIALGFIAWAPAMCLMVVSAACARLADKAIPHSREGNCWSYALSKWTKHGGYMLVRAADGQRFLRRFWVPHVAWVQHIGDDTDMKFFVPTRRKSTSWVPWYVVYYSGRIFTREKPHDAGADSSVPPNA